MRGANDRALTFPPSLPPSRYSSHLKEAFMKISARNQLSGTVKHLAPVAVNSEVVVELPGGLQIVSVITKDSAERLGLAPGKKVTAVIKSSDVMIAVE
jgi:molybdopterin-binding protein